LALQGQVLEDRKFVPAVNYKEHRLWQMFSRNTEDVKIRTSRGNKVFLKFK
jgi:hypothetical protein